MNQNNEPILQIPDAPLFVCEVDDKQLGLKGWLVIHSIGNRGSCGGVRLYPDVTKEETMALAKGMTYKYCICGYSLGGAKAGVQIPFDCDLQKRAAMLEDFGRHIGPLIKSRIYHPWTDMNCSVDDLRYICKGAGKQLNSTPADSTYFTALSTFSALSAVAEHLGIRPAQCTVTIEGFGGVGSHLAVEIARWGGKVLAVSNRRGAVYNSKGLDVQSLFEKRKQLGDAWIDRQGQYDHLACEQLFSVDTTIHIPCARVHSLSSNRAEILNCRAIVPAANEPFAPGVERKMFEKGILSLPYFVVNAGGIIGSGLASHDATDAQIREIFAVEFHQMTARLLKLSEKAHESPIEIAAREAAGYYKSLFGSVSPGKTRQSFLSKLRITRRLSRQLKLQHKLKELKLTFNSRFSPRMGDAGIEPATR